MAKLLKASSLTAASVLSMKQFSASVTTEESTKAVSKSAICVMVPLNKSGVKGLVSFHQKHFSASVQVVANMVGMNPNSSYALDIHEFGDLTNTPDSVGQPFTPASDSVDKPTGQRGNGNLGSLKTNERGNGYLASEEEHFSLFGDQSIVGRAVSLQPRREEGEEEEKGQSQEPRVACGVIGLTDKFKSLPPA